MKPAAEVRDANDLAHEIKRQGEVAHSAALGFYVGILLSSGQNRIAGSTRPSHRSRKMLAARL